MLWLPQLLFTATRDAKGTKDHRCGLPHIYLWMDVSCCRPFYDRKRGYVMMMGVNVLWYTMCECARRIVVRLTQPCLLTIFHLQYSCFDRIIVHRSSAIHNLLRRKTNIQANLCCSTASRYQDTFPAHDARGRKPHSWVKQGRLLASWRNHYGERVDSFISLADESHNGTVYCDADTYAIASGYSNI